MDTHIFVYRHPSEIGDSELDALLQSLPLWRREQAMRFKHRQGRAECALSYTMLCHALHVVYGIDEQPSFAIGEHGKPTLPSLPDIHFNISHCRHAIAVAVGSKPVGVDVESMGRRSESVTRYAMNSDECQRIALAASPDAEFTRLWTQKEALVKLTGTGITDHLHTLLTNSNASISTFAVDGTECFLSIATAAPHSFTVEYLN